MHNQSVVDPKKGESVTGEAAPTRLAIAMWVTSMDIIDFASANGITL